MALLEVADLEFGYSNEPLFTKVTLRLNAGERAALVAPNGAGKSTLLRLIAGELAPDKGTALLFRDRTLGYYRQSHETRAEGSVLDALMSGFTELLSLRSELDLAQREAISGAKEALDRLANATDRYHQAGADRLEHRVEAIATRLGFPPETLARDVTTLSGGERGRLALGVVLAKEPDLLLLDEPTNHLDLETISWLEGYLVDHRGAMLIVSHDRAFLDTVCPITMELGRTNFRTYPLSYSAYHVEREADLERERRLAEEQAAFVQKTEEFIRKNMAGQKTKQAQSRRKMLDKLERVERPEDVWAKAERIRFRFADAPRSGDIVLEARGLGAERGEIQLFSGVELLLRRGDRLGIVGPNGCGKSTLMKLLAGRGQAKDRGDVRRGTNLRDGYFDQHLGSLDEARTAVEEIRSVRGDLNVDGARQYLARFRFYGDDPLRRVASFSGGERTRLALGKLLLEPRNLLFLDEPTNHLDIPATEILEEALVGFEGSVVLVSHDRRFLETVTTRTLAFQADGVDVYEGGFRDYCEAIERKQRPERFAVPERKAGQPKTQPGERRAGAASAASAAGAGAPSAAGAGARGAGAAGSGAGAGAAGADAHRARRAASRDAERKTKRVAELEAAIAKAEPELAGYRAELKETGASAWERLHDLAQKEQALSRTLEKLTEEWLKLSDEIAKFQAG